MINNAESKKLYKVQSGVTEYPIGFPFQCNSDGVPQLAVTIGTTYLQLNYNCKLSEDNGTLILIPTEEEAETLTGPEDYSWMDKWVDAPLVITRDIPFVQESDYQVGRISPEQIEKDFDASVMRDQILLDKIGEHTTDVSEELESLHTDISDINAELATKATKTELNNYKLEANAAIDANAEAIQKTRDDYIAADSEIRQTLDSHTSELATLRGNQASLGNQVAGIEEKIPESASGSNPLITKQQLSGTETDIRKDLNSGLSGLQTQITAQAAEIKTKQDKLIAGDNIVIGSDGKTISATGAGGGAGLSFIVYDALPETGESGIIYLIPKDSEAPDVYDEYVWITATSTFELIGNTQVDLTDYAKKEDLNDYLPLSGGTLTSPLTIEPSEKAQQASGFVTMLTFVAEQEGGGYKATKNIRLTPLGELGFGNTSISGLGSIVPYNTVQNIGTSKLKWFTVYAKGLNNGADIAIPTEGGTLARLEDLENIDTLPDQTGNAGKFLKTDGSEASWEDVPPSVTITLKEYDE